MTEGKRARTAVERRLDHKIWLGKWALLFEQLWPRLWLLIGLVAFFILVSLLGLWSALDGSAHRIVLGAFALAFLAALVHAARIRWPGREAAMRRLERVSGVAHRPASSYGDRLTGDQDSAATQALWDAHRSWLQRLIGKLRAGPPKPGVYQLDPMALRTLLVLSVLIVFALAGDSAKDRLFAAFRFEAGAAAAEARLDAWVTPPGYTAKPPIMLADGSKPTPAAESRILEVPEKSVLVARLSGVAGANLALDVTEPGAGAPRRFEAAVARGGGDVAEVKLELSKNARVQVSKPAALATWEFTVTPDQAPKIALTKDPEQSRRGSMKLYYRVEDDYGVTSAEAKVAKLPAAAGDPAKAWARKELKGPRPPLERPPQLTLRVPQGARDAEANTYLEIGSHPWAGIAVTMTLEARDVAGNIGRSEPVRMVLPSRHFDKPLARAVAEQRRKLVDDPRNRPDILKALDALTIEPQDFIEDQRIYLGLRSAYYRLLDDDTRAGRASVAAQLWHVALRIEDGDLSDAERRLKDAQEKLSKALEEGASEEEIKQLMQELREALNDYTRQLAQQAENEKGDMPEGADPSRQMLKQEDLDRMLRDLEDAAKNGSREQAQQMLSELRDLMDRLQSGKMTKEEAQQSREMMEMMNQLGNMVGEQQQLMDDTFMEQRKLDGSAQPGGQVQKGKKGQGGKGEQAQRGKPGQGELGQEGRGQQGQGGQLGQRQSSLGEKLERLQRSMREKGVNGAPDKLDGARDAMKEAEEALNNGDYPRATEEQAEALDKMRQGAQSMAQEMLQNSPQRYGQSGDTPRDPLGRPQKSQGPDLGTSVKVPDAIDAQRAREILEELRRRVGEPQRPAGEIDYIERLLRRY